MCSLNGCLYKSILYKANDWNVLQMQIPQHFLCIIHAFHIWMMLFVESDKFVFECLDQLFLECRNAMELLESSRQLQFALVT